MTTQDPELSAALGWPGGISDPVLDRTRLLQMVAALMQDKLWEDHRVRHLWDHVQEQVTMTADDLADSINRGEKFKVIGCIGHDCEECQTRIARDALGNFQHQRKGT